MRSRRVGELHKCCVRNCLAHSTTVVQKTFGDEKILYSYCEFHAVISGTFFTGNKDRVVLGRMEASWD